MKAVPVFLRPMTYVALVGAVLTVFCWFLVPLATPAVWMVTLVSGVASLIGLAAVGIVRLARRLAKPS